MKRTGVRRAYLSGATGLLAMGLALAAAGPTQAHGDPGSAYMGDKKGAKVEATRVYEPGPDQTTFTFELTLNPGEQQVSHVLLAACPDINILGSTGPDGANREPKEGNEPFDDPKTHKGIKYDPGLRGTYTIVFAGNVAGAEFVIKDGDAHKHYPSGEPSDVCKLVTPSETTPTTTGGETTPTTTGGETTATTTGANTAQTNDPPNTPAANQPSQSGTEVAAGTASKPGSDVLGEQLIAPEALATLPRTGLALPALASTGTMLLALGGLATALGRRRRG